MPSCRNCGTEIGASYNFCQTCATPQTDEATRRLTEYIDDCAKQRGGGETAMMGGDELRRRLRYAIGNVAVVAGLATVTDGAGLFFLLAGLVVLPPVQTLIESRIGRRLGDRPTAAAVGGLFVIGAATFVLV